MPAPSPHHFRALEGRRRFPLFLLILASWELLGLTPVGMARGVFLLFGALLLHLGYAGEARRTLKGLKALSLGPRALPVPWFGREGVRGKGGLGALSFPFPLRGPLGSVPTRGQEGLVRLPRGRGFYPFWLPGPLGWLFPEGAGHS